MILNRLEYIMMNNPIRAYLQENREIRTLRDLSSLEAGKNVLEIGCGNGTGTSLIRKYFSPEKIHAIDLDPRMIERAKKNHSDDSVTFEIASATNLPYETNSFDAVFDFGIIHHIPDSKLCLEELKRVLKPDGELILEDLSTETFETTTGRVLKRLTEHPYDDMFSQVAFSKHLNDLGFQIIEEKTYNPAHILRYFVIIAKS